MPDMVKVEIGARRFGRTYATRLTLSLCYEGRFAVRKSMLGWYVGRGRAMAIFPTWECAWRFMFGVSPYEDYPGQAYFHAHNANIRRAEESAT